jgi:Xaa-Pro aminopeptidase
MFAAKTYSQRRATLRGFVGSGLILFPGHEESPMNFRDNPYHFRQETSFLYFFGLGTPGHAGIIDADDGREILFGDDPTLDDVVWTGPVTPFAERAAAAGVTETLPREKLGEIIGKALAAGRKIHYLPPVRDTTTLELHRLLGVPPGDVAAGVSQDLMTGVIALRSIKEAGEIAEIEAALEVSWEMFTRSMVTTRPGVSEREIAGLVEGIAVSGAGGLAFPVIFSKHGEILHNHDQKDVLGEGDLALLDCGAQAASGYASDITRTFPVSGRFDERQRAIYSLVLSALTEATAGIAPGVPFRDLHVGAARRMAGGLVDLGLMKGDPDAAVAAGAHALFFPHGLGHMMGLDVHDREGISENQVGYGDGWERSEQFGLAYLRLAKPLVPGHVVTVEPGLYLIPQLIDQWRAEGRHDEFVVWDEVERWKGFGGVRIEDDVLVTEDGHRILGRPIPKQVDEVENLCSRD